MSAERSRERERSKDKDRSKDKVKQDLDTTQCPEAFTYLSSKARRLDFQFARIPSAFYVWNDCAYRSKPMKYRRWNRPTQTRTK